MSENTDSGKPRSIKPFYVQQYESLGLDPVESRIARTVSFLWKVEPTDAWAGFNQEAFRELSGQVASMVGITPFEADKITIHFADSATPVIQGKKQITAAVCLPITTRGGEIEECMILLNRSREVAEYVISDDYMKERDDQHRLVDGVEHTTETTLLTFEAANPYEHIVATLVEELSHAHVALRAGTMERLRAWEMKYLSSLRARKTVTSHLYETDLKEITASRVKLQVLSRLLEKKDPARAAYFRDLYKESLRTGKLVLEEISDKILNEVYIPTGFDPKKFNLKVPE